MPSSLNEDPLSSPLAYFIYCPIYSIYLSSSTHIFFFMYLFLAYEGHLAYKFISLLMNPYLVRKSTFRLPFCLWIHFWIPCLACHPFWGCKSLFFHKSMFGLRVGFFPCLHMNAFLAYEYKFFAYESISSCRICFSFVINFEVMSSFFCLWVST